MLTTKKFIKEVEKLGFEVGESMDAILIFYGRGQVSYVRINERFYVGMIDGFENLPEELQAKLYYLMDDYARTPLDERETQQKFYLKFAPLGDGGCFNYLNYNSSLNCIRLNDCYQTPMCKTQFTQKEIDDIKEKFKVTLCDFEQIPVDEDEKKEWSEEE
jgi:hypothetical protein